MTDLVKRAKKGDKEAFILLMDHHRQMLYNTALLAVSYTHLTLPTTERV